MQTPRTDLDETMALSFRGRVEAATASVLLPVAVYASTPPPFSTDPSPCSIGCRGLP
jgi:hypothetical protein